MINVSKERSCRKVKKLAIGILSAAFILGAGTAVFAAGNNNSSNSSIFEEMLPSMQKMHPDSSKEELKDMYRSCHEDGSMMDQTNGNESMDMMNNL
jgi:hypothetical protein